MTFRELVDGVREEGSIMGRKDMDGQIRMGLSELVEKLGCVRFVDPVP